MGKNSTDLYWQRRLAGRCTRCGGETGCGKSTCPPCSLRKYDGDRKRNPYARNSLCRAEGSFRVVPLDGKPPLGADVARGFIERHGLPQRRAARILGCHYAHLETLLARKGRLPKLDFEVLHMAIQRYEERLRDAG